MRSHDKLLVFFSSAVGMAKGAKKRRIGSDDYTLDLERRIGDLEKFMTTFKKMEADLREKDKRIEILEKEITELKNVSSVTNPDLVQSIAGNAPLASTSTVDCSSVEGKPREKIDFLIIGDSIVGSFDAQFPDGKKGKVVSVRGASPKDVLKEFERLSLTQDFGHIIVHVGTNLIPNFSPDYVADSIIDTMLCIKKLSRNSKVAFSGLLPKCDDSWSRSIDMINGRVARAGLNVPPSMRFGYMHHFPAFFRNGWVNFKELYKKDRIHLSLSGSKLFTSGLKTYLIDNV